MERFTYRSTSLIGLEAEMRQRDLQVEADRAALARVVRGSGFRLRLPFLRRRSR